jgi:hypothetical protein
LTRAQTQTRSLGESRKAGVVPTFDQIKQTNGQPHLAWARQADLPEHCFLCDAPLTPANQTVEHVFPKWLLKNHGLAKSGRSSVKLLNKTDLPYRQATIPCCRSCNNEWLSRAEAQVGAAFEAGYEAVAALDPDLLYSWLAKIYYGMLYREALLPEDRSQPDGLRIVDPDALDQVAMLRMLLQWFQGQTEWSTTPGSVWVFRAQTLDNPELNFDFADNFISDSIGLRIGETAVIACLTDWGFVKNCSLRPLTVAQSLSLHPLQFRETLAVVIDTRVRLRFDPCYMALFIEEPQHTLLMPCWCHWIDPPLEKWSRDRWAHIAANYTGVAREVLMPDDQHMCSFLTSDGVTPQSLPYDETSWVFTANDQTFEFHQNPAAYIRETAVVTATEEGSES